LDLSPAYDRGWGMEHEQDTGRQVDTVFGCIKKREIPLHKE
jgi:hypothetical protein